jgi:hypothetical protein
MSIQSGCDGAHNFVTGLNGNFDGKNIVAIGPICSKGAGINQVISDHVDDHHRGPYQGQPFHFQCPVDSSVTRIAGKNRITCTNWKTGTNTQHVIKEIQDPNSVDLWDSSVPDFNAKGVRLLAGRVQLYTDSQKEDFPDVETKAFRNGQLEDRREYHPLLRGDVGPKSQSTMKALESTMELPIKDRQMLIWVTLLTLITLYFMR